MIFSHPKEPLCIGEETAPLARAEDELAAAICSMYNGIAFTDQKLDVLDRFATYKEELGATLLDSIGIMIDEEGLTEREAEVDAVETIIESSGRVMATAGHDHAVQSPFEGIRHFTEMSAVRQSIGALAFVGATAAAYKGIDSVTEFSNHISAFTSVGAVGVVRKVIKPGQIFQSAYTAIGDRLKDHGIGKIKKNGPGKSMKEIRNSTKHIKDKTERRRTEYGMITQANFEQDLRPKVWAEIGPRPLDNPETRENTLNAALSVMEEEVLYVCKIDPGSRSKLEKPFVNRHIPQPVEDIAGVVREKWQHKEIKHKY